MSIESPLVLALDQGSHASRAVVFDSAGDVIAAHQVDVAEQRRGALEIEQDAREIVSSIEHCIASVAGTLGSRRTGLQAVGLATQRSSIVCWDTTTGEPLSPVISWQDRRTFRETEALAVHAETITQRTGLRLSPHYGASKLHWCLEHLPAVAQAQSNNRLCLGPLASFIAFHLLRERSCLCDPANAGRTLLWNVEHGDWDDWLCSLFGISRTLLPRIVPTVADLGSIHIDDQRVPLRCLSGDQPAALFSLGEPDPGAFYCNIGTGAFVQALLPVSSVVPSGLLRSVALDDGQHRLTVMEGTVNGAGSAITWALDALGIDGDVNTLATALREADDALLFLNGIGGLGSPYWLPEFESGFVGDGTPQQKLAAVGESIVFLLATVVARMGAVVQSPTRIIVTGGLSKVSPLCQRLADVTDLLVERPTVTEATARGAAFLAAGRPRTWRSQSKLERFRPKNDTALRARYQQWQRKMEQRLGAGH